MPGTNLTRDEAETRAALITVDHYDIALDLTTGPRTFNCVETITFAAEDGASTFLDAITESVERIELNGNELDPSEFSDGVRITLPNLQAQNTLSVAATMRYTNTGEGLHRFIDPVDDEVYLYSQFEVPDARRMFPNFEQPDLKATFAFTITAPDKWTVISNAPTPEPELLDDGAARWTFPTTSRISTYITALIAGPYASFTDELTSSDGRTIPLGVFARASLAQYVDADYIFAKTKQGFTFYEDAFGVPYPFEKYDQLFVPEFNAGAMENAGAVTITETYVFRSQVPDALRERRVVTVLHELAHMWFGDLVTMKWWNDLWLNESFAEFMSTLATSEATEWTNDWTTFNASEKSWAYRQDQLPTTHPIVATIRDLEDVLVNFDGITYAKGASVLKQLVAWVGRDKFFAGVHEYFLKHAHSNTVLNDLLSELAATSGRDVANWSSLWLETAGVNTIWAEFELDEHDQFTRFDVRQSATEEYPTLRPHRLGIGIYSLVDGALVRTDGLEVDIDGERTPIAALEGHARGDLILVNDGDLTYAKLHLDERSQATAREHLRDITDPLARGIVWSALWESTRDAHLPAREYIDIVLNNVSAETESTTLRTILNQLRLASTAYVTQADRTQYQSLVADGLWMIAQTAKPGSDAQFQFVRAFAGSAATGEQLGIIHGLLAGTTTLEGLTVDTDLHWELLIALVVGGAATEADADAMLEFDPTASGKQFHARALAAIPTPEHKLSTQSNLFLDDSMPNAIVRATSAGIIDVREPSLLSELVEPFFSHIDEIWSTRSYAIAEEIIAGSFPSPLANAALLNAAHTYLDDDTQPAALRRIMLEATSGLERALDAQRRDAAAKVAAAEVASTPQDTPAAQDTPATQ